jgi:hypothetical protein
VKELLSGRDVILDGLERLLDEHGEIVIES